MGVRFDCTPFFIEEEIIVVDDSVLNALIGLGGAIFGAGASLIGVKITLKRQHLKDLELQKNQFKKETEVWLRDKRLSLYIELISILERFHIFVDAATIIDGEGIVDNEPILIPINELNKYIDNHQGELLLYLSNKRYGDIYRLRGEIYRFINDNDKHIVNLYEIQNSEINKIVLMAKKVSYSLKNDLGINDKDEKL